MNELTDIELLERFAQGGSEEAFTALVDRHVNLVHSAALRCVASPHQAEEVTQAVFIILAHKAGTLSPKTVLSGWLYRTARLTAANFLRTESRRTQREQEAYMQSTLEDAPTTDVWNDLSPLLDNAMTQLGKTDHDALVLRYFQNKSLQEVGSALGVGERAAQKRVGRALDRLRRVFHRCGVTATTAAIAGVISTYSVQAAPAGLVETICAAAVRGSAVAGSTLTLVKGTISIMSWIKAKTAVAIGASALVITAGVATAHYRTARAAEAREMEAREHRVSLGYGSGSGGGELGSVASEREAKLRDERNGGGKHLAADPKANKAEDEQKARAELAVPRQQ